MPTCDERAALAAAIVLGTVVDVVVIVVVGGEAVVVVVADVDSRPCHAGRTVCLAGVENARRRDDRRPVVTVVGGAAHGLPCTFGTAIRRANTEPSIVGAVVVVGLEVVIDDGRVGRNGCVEPAAAEAIVGDACCTDRANCMWLAVGVVVGANGE